MAAYAAIAPGGAPAAPDALPPVGAVPMCMSYNTGVPQQPGSSVGVTEKQAEVLDYYRSVGAPSAIEGLLDALMCRKPKGRVEMLRFLSAEAERRAAEVEGSGAAPDVHAVLRAAVVLGELGEAELPQDIVLAADCVEGKLSARAKRAAAVAQLLRDASQRLLMSGPMSPAAQTLRTRARANTLQQRGADAFRAVTSGGSERAPGMPRSMSLMNMMSMSTTMRHPSMGAPDYMTTPENTNLLGRTPQARKGSFPDIQSPADPYQMARDFALAQQHAAAWRLQLSCPDGFRSFPRSIGPFASAHVPPDELGAVSLSSDTHYLNLPIEGSLEELFTELHESGFCEMPTQSFQAFVSPFAPCSPSFRPVSGEAAHGAWVSPTPIPSHATLAIDEEQLWRASLALSFVRFGGFVFVDSQMGIQSVTALAGSTGGGDGELSTDVFDGPFDWPDEFTAPLRSQGTRMHMIPPGHPMRTRGVQEACWLLPHETLTSSQGEKWTPTGAGGGILFLREEQDFGRATTLMLDRQRGLDTPGQATTDSPKSAGAGYHNKHGAAPCVTPPGVTPSDQPLQSRLTSQVCDDAAHAGSGGDLDGPCYFVRAATPFCDFPERMNNLGIITADPTALSPVISEGMWTLTDDAAARNGIPVGAAAQVRSGLSPWQPLSLGLADRERAFIPPPAQFYCWANPLWSAEEAKALGLLPIPEKAKPELLFCLLGGFLYVGDKGAVVAANTISIGSRLRFAAPLPWRPSFMWSLQQKGRLGHVTHPTLLMKGAKWFAWVHGGETLIDQDGDTWEPGGGHGGWAYFHGDAPDPRDVIFHLITDRFKGMFERDGNLLTLAPTMPSRENTLVEISGNSEHRRSSTQPTSRRSSAERAAVVAPPAKPAGPAVDSGPRKHLAPHPPVSSTVLRKQKQQDRGTLDRVEELLGPDTAPMAASPFACMVISAAGAGHSYSAAAFRCDRAFPWIKRLACVLLSLLGRREDAESRTEWESLIPAVRLSRPLSKLPERLQITLTGDVVDLVAQRARVAGIADDPVWDDICLDDRELAEATNYEGPSGTQLYGGGRWTCSAGQIARLGATLHAHTTSMPGELYRSFLAWCEGEEHALMFHSHYRSVPLADIGSESAGASLLQRYHTMSAKLAGDVEQARRAIDALRARAAQPEDFRAQLGSQRYEWDDFRMQAECYNGKIAFLSTPAAAATTRSFVGWVAGLRALPADRLRDELGFDGDDPAAELEAVLAQSLTELSTGVCVSQRGHFLIDGARGAHNQLCMPPAEPVTFLSVPGVDFCTAPATVREAQRYFMRPELPDTVPPQRGWQGWLPGGKVQFLTRVRRLYRAVFSACRAQGVRSPSMLPLGLGVFLMNLHEHDRVVVRHLYFRAQFELLCEEDWGFDAYYLNAGPPAQGPVARAVLQEVTSVHRLRCDIVLHSKDAKFLAVELAKAGRGAGLLNPSDCRAVMLGVIGCFWEQQRGDGYVGEEDIACTSTHITAAKGVCWPPEQIDTAPGSFEHDQTAAMQAMRDKDRRTSIGG